MRQSLPLLANGHSGVNRWLREEARPCHLLFTMHSRYLRVEVRDAKVGRSVRHVGQSAVQLLRRWDGCRWG